MRIQSIRSLGLLALAAGVLCLVARADASETPSKKRARKLPVLKKTKFDPTAKRVDFFKAMEEGQIGVKVVARNSLSGKLLIENKTKQPLTVEMPDAFVGVQVVNQVGGAGLGGGNNGGGLGGGLGGGGNNGGGQGFGGGGNGNGGGGIGGGGNNFFSIPPERVASYGYSSVCLEHGKAEPNPRMTYKIVPVEKYSKDVRLAELCRLVGTGRIPSGAAQAAAWNLANKMSWRQLAGKQMRRSTGNTPYFSRGQLMLAQRLVAEATGRARKRIAAEKKKASGADSNAKPPVRGR